MRGVFSGRIMALLAEKGWGFGIFAGSLPVSRPILAVFEGRAAGRFPRDSW